MGARDSLQKIADRKALEINNLKLQLAQAEAYLQAIQDSLKVLPRELNDPNAEPELRVGSLLAQARDVLRLEGKPMHVNKILEKMGRDVDKSNRISLSGSMAAYVRKGVIFRKAGPNIFALREVTNQTENVEDGEENDLPASFGNLQ